jgi:3-hydroxyisobutyrate dehydrogenase-like beta-hydroxyacid dehydrogenase
MMHKDIRLALASPREQKLELPSAESADKLLTRAMALGYEHRDIASIFQVLGELSLHSANRHPPHLESKA